MLITLLMRQRKHQITSHARGEGTDRLGMTVPMKDAEAALKSLGMSEKGMEKETWCWKEDISAHKLYLFDIEPFL